MGPLQLLRMIMRNNPRNTERVYQVPINENRSVLFDNISGLGETPNHRNVNYRGATTLLTPKEYYWLTSQRTGDINPRIVDAIKREEGIAAPQLYIDIPKRFGEDRAPYVGQHEGRNRMEAINALAGNPVTSRQPLIPVQLYPGGLRSRDLSGGDLRDFFNNVVSQRGFEEPVRRRNAAVINGEFVEFSHGGLAQLSQ